MPSYFWHKHVFIIMSEAFVLIRIDLFRSNIFRINPSKHVCLNFWNVCSVLLFQFQNCFFVSIVSTAMFYANIVWWIFDCSLWNLEMLKFQLHFSIVFSFWLLSFYLNLFWYHFCRLKFLKNSFQKHKKHIFYILLTGFIYLNIETSRAYIAMIFFCFANKWKCRQNMRWRKYSNIF